MRKDMIILDEKNTLSIPDKRKFLEVTQIAVDIINEEEFVKIMIIIQKALDRVALLAKEQGVDI